jgi:dTDP-4-amino-4,6-dideoxygalactose transaminase
MHIPFSPPYITEESIDNVNNVLRSGWITSGPVMAKLEDSLDQYLGRKCLTFNSWTSAATILFSNLKKLHPKKKYVLIPNYTYVATFNAVYHAGLIPILVDVDLNFLISIEALEDKLNELGDTVLAIMPVEYAGFIPDYRTIRNLTTSKSLNPFIIGDAAHSFGSKLELSSKRAKEFDCDFLIYSMHAVKNLTSAEGGFIAFKSSTNENLINTILLSRLNFQSKSALEKNQVGAWEYDITDIGFKANLPDVLAAIALGQLRTYEHLLDTRRTIAQFYNDLFSKCEWALSPQLSNDIYISNCHLYPLRIVDEEIRRKFMEYLGSCNIAYNVHFKPVSMLSFYTKFFTDLDDYPVSQKLFSEEISLPIHHEMNDDSKNYIHDKFNQFFRTI